MPLGRTLLSPTEGLRSYAAQLFLALSRRVLAALYLASPTSTNTSTPSSMPRSTARRAASSSVRVRSAGTQRSTSSPSILATKQMRSMSQVCVLSRKLASRRTESGVRDPEVSSFLLHRRLVLWQPPVS